MDVGRQVNRRLPLGHGSGGGAFSTKVRKCATTKRARSPSTARARRRQTTDTRTEGRNPWGRARGRSHRQVAAPMRAENSLLILWISSCSRTRSIGTSGARGNSVIECSCSAFLIALRSHFQIGQSCRAPGQGAHHSRRPGAQRMGRGAIALQVTSSVRKPHQLFRIISPDELAPIARNENRLFVSLAIEKNSRMQS
jgi:hypothetical protein